MIYHYLKDGTQVPEVTGYLLTKEANEALYEVITAVMKGKSDET